MQISRISRPPLAWRRRERQAFGQGREAFARLYDGGRRQVHLCPPRLLAVLSSRVSCACGLACALGSLQVENRGMAAGACRIGAAMTA